MTRALVTTIVGCLLIGALTGAQEPRLPGGAMARSWERIDVEKRNVGIVVGVVEPAGQRIVSLGTFGLSDPRAVDGDTVFEIGSITKLFTSLLLTDMVERGEARLDDPVSGYLPSTVKVPEREGKQITLQDLATHTSGIQRLPSNMRPANMANPYSDYGAPQLYEFLSGYSPCRVRSARNTSIPMLASAFSVMRCRSNLVVITNA